MGKLSIDNRKFGNQKIVNCAASGQTGSVVGVVEGKQGNQSLTEEYFIASAVTPQCGSAVASEGGSAVAPEGESAFAPAV